MEDILKLYRDELARLQAERDTARDESRRLWAAIGLLKGAAGELLGTMWNVKEASNNDEFLRVEGIQAVIDSVVVDIEQASKLTWMNE